MLFNVKNFYFDFYMAQNKFHYLFKHKLYLTALLAVLTLALAIVGFLFENNHLFLSITKSLKFFTFGFPDEFNPYNIFILLATILATTTVFLAAIFTFFQDYFNRQIAKKVLQQPHIALFGLGEINRAFLNSDFTQSQKSVIVVEQDAKNVHLDELRSKGVGVIIGDVLASTQFDLFNFEQTEHAIIALGNDQLNIEVAIRIIGTIKATKVQSPTRLIVHISDKRLSELFHQNFITPSTQDDIKIDIKTFSFYEECAKELFEKYDIDGGFENYTRQDKPFSTVVCGDGELALHVIENILLLSNLPYENKHTVYLATSQAPALMEKIAYRFFYTPEKFPSVVFVPLALDTTSTAFYAHDVWKRQELVNAILCYDSEEVNLKIAIELQQRIYLRNEHLRTNVLIGMFDEYSLAGLIDKDHNAFNRFFTFGNKNRLFDLKNLLDEDNYRIAKTIHFGYGDAFDKNILKNDTSELDKKWFKNAKYSDKLSNIAQSKHINVKLKALGLKKERSPLRPEELLKANHALFDTIIVPLMEEAGLSHENLARYSLELDKFWNHQAYEVFYAPKAYTTLFQRLIACEHERWNSYHYLNGWEYGVVKDKSKKIHDCLKMIEEFSEPSLQITIIYDIYSIVYIPNYLANTGWLIIKDNDDA